jgi:hypothetical protein
MATFAPYSHGAWISAMEGGEDDQETINRELEEIVKLDISYPVFVRSDLASAKHSGPESYRADNPNDLRKALLATAEDNELKFWLEPDQPQAFMFRPFLSLRHAFTAFSGHPIANEWRYFIKDGEIQCSHFYWPTHALIFHGAEPRNWRSQLRSLRGHRPDWDVALRAKQAAVACADHNYWSVDFAQGENGDWWLIDMAIGESSWHPDCKHVGDN